MARGRAPARARSPRGRAAARDPRAAPWLADAFTNNAQPIPGQHALIVKLLLLTFPLIALARHFDMVIVAEETRLALSTGI